MAKVGDIVEVVWIDAVCDASETTAADASDPPTCYTWGELIAQNDKWIRVGGERLDDGKPGSVPIYRGITTIPRPWRLRVRRV